jgi:uncharacterized membrane protein
MSETTPPTASTAGRAVSPDRAEPAPVTAPGILLGIGLGGFVDGIVLHQILQWHHLLSETERYPPTTVANLEVNTLADGLFHAGTWLAVAAGLALLWRSVRRGGRARSGRCLLGWMAVGWGLFNLVEGIVDHHLLQIHRVRPQASNPLAWDLGFLALGALLVAAGWLLQRSAAPGRTRGAGRRVLPARRGGSPVDHRAANGAP